MKVFVSQEDPPKGIYYRQFYEEVEEVGEFVHQQTGSYRTQRDMSGGIKRQNYKEVWGLEWLAGSK